MNAQNASLVLLWCSTPAAIAFVLIYGRFQPWFRSWTGRALFVSSASLAALLTVNLLFRLFNWSVLAREGWTRDIVYLFITIGAYLMLTALLRVLWRARGKS